MDLVALYAFETQRAAVAVAGAVSLGSLFMVYQYAQQAGGVIGSIAAHLQGFARVRTDYASADPIWEADERGPAAPVDRDWREVHVLARQPLLRQMVEAAPGEGSPAPTVVLASH